MVIFTKDIITWTGKGISKLRNCENYERYSKIPVCKGVDKVSSMFWEQPTETGRIFDNGLFLAFVFGFFSFLITSIYTILAEDSKSLKEISNKVIRTTDTIVTVLRTMWTLKVSKESNATLEEELIEIRKSNGQHGSPYALLENLEEEVEIPEESTKLDSNELMEQIEFSLNDDWHPPKAEEAKQLPEIPPSDPIHDVDKNKGLKASPRNTRSNSPQLLKLKSGKAKHFARDPNLQVLYEKKSAEAYSMHSRCDEAPISHAENLRESRWSTANPQSSRLGKRYTSNAHRDARQQCPPDFIAVNRQQSRMSYLSYSSKKHRSGTDDGNYHPQTKGIFDQRRRDKARARRNNNSEMNSAPVNWDVMSMNSGSVKSRNIRNDRYNRDNRTSVIPEYSR